MRRIFIFIFSFLLLFSCGKKKKRTLTTLPPPVATERKTVKEEKKQKKEELYVYQGYKYRNPFHPLVGATLETKIKPQEVAQESLGLNIDALTLQGIMIDSEGKKYALLVGGDGLPYFLKDHKLTDVNGKVVQGITGTVIENRVIIVKGGKSRVLFLPENQ